MLFVIQVMDVSITICRRLESIQRNLEQNKYQTCSKISATIAELAWNLEMEIEVFIGEVLESSFRQLEYALVENGRIDSSTHKEIAKKTTRDMSNALEKLIVEYRNKNVNGIHNCLSKLRYTATFHQLNILKMGT